MVKKYKPLLLSFLLIPSVAVNAFASQGVQVNGMAVVAQDEALAAVSPISQDMPMGQGAGSQPSLLPEDTAGSEDLFGMQGGYFHPYIFHLGYSHEIFGRRMLYSLLVQSFRLLPRLLLLKQAFFDWSLLIVWDRCLRDRFLQNANHHNQCGKCHRQ